MKTRIYLAGPISNCNERQMHEWRDEIIARWKDEFDFVDPTRSMDGERTPFEIAERDRAAILECDAILANMWKESIGTAIGIAQAAHTGRPVFVIDPNRLDSRALAFYANAVVTSPAEGMLRVREYFRTQERLRFVIKRNGTEVPFDSGKIARSLRNACRAAGQDDLIVPTRVVPEVLGRLIGGKGRVLRTKVSSTVIRDIVWDVLSAFESNPRWSEVANGVRVAWEAHDRKRRSGTRTIDKSARVTVHEQALRIRIFSPKSHATIWGHAVRSLQDVPSSARPIFEEIAKVEGISEIRLGLFGGTRSRSRARTCVEISASRQPGILEGKCFDNAAGGKVQTFQIRLPDPARTEAVRQTVVAHLGRLGMLSSSAAD